MVRGEVRSVSRQAYREPIARSIAHGAQGIVLGCTEITLLVRAKTAPCRYSTTSLTSKRPSSAPCPSNHCLIMLADVPLQNCNESLLPGGLIVVPMPSLSTASSPCRS